jgi:hypothetical protein
MSTRGERAHHDSKHSYVRIEDQYLPLGLYVPSTRGVHEYAYVGRNNTNQFLTSGKFCTTEK